MRAIILGYRNRTGVAETIAVLRPSIQKYAEIVQEDLTGSADLTETEADIALVFGGDGSILRAVQQMGERQLPILAVNLGRLGFLASLSRDDDLLAVLEHLARLKKIDGAQWVEKLQAHALKQDFSIASYRLLDCTVTKNEGTKREKRISSLVMNETAIQSAAFHIIDVAIWADGESLTTCRCDGMILSTPIGSTAHNLSVGGPILRPGLEAVVISPIAPHSMTFRPIVDSAMRTYTMRLRPGSTEAAVIVDGRQIAEITSSDRVEITPSSIQFRLLNIPGFSYFTQLQKKLGWGGHLI